MSRFVLLFILLVGPALLNGLSGCTNCERGLKATRFGIQEYRSYPRKINRETPNLPYLIDTLVTNDTLNYSELELILIGKETRLASQYRSFDGSAAWACDPAVYALDSIRRITITSDQPFSGNLEAGTDLTTVITIGGGLSQVPLATFLAERYKPAQSFYSLRFSRAPERIAAHRFTVTVDLGRGKLAAFTTRPVFIKP